MAGRRSIRQLKQQAAAGDGNAACQLGDRYRQGDGVGQDSLAAFQWYERGAALGDPSAQNNIGSAYLNGLGCQVDKAKAVYWYEKSAEQGNADAQYNLAKRYLHGDGANVDCARALEWFSRAGRQGNAEALCDMGTMFWQGNGVCRNLLSAADLHLAAAEAGDDVACRNLGEYEDDLKQIAISGSQRASIFLCRMYNRGFGVEKSQALTWTWIVWAKEHCTPDGDAEIRQEILEAYDFYAKTIDLENRRAGKQALAALLKACSAKHEANRAAPCPSPIEPYQHKQPS